MSVNMINYYVKVALAVILLVVFIAFVQQDLDLIPERETVQVNEVN